VEAALERGLEIDYFAPRISFFFDVHNDFFEEIAKFRAARRIWATEMKERYGAKNPRSWMLRTHAQTAGVSLTAQQPLNNIVRVAIQALAAVLGGTNSLHTDSYDEALALPTEEAATIALRTQQIIAYESGVTHTIDPLAGSYYVEWLTDKVEEEARNYIEAIRKMGEGTPYPTLYGVIRGIENGYFQREIADASYRFQQEVESGERIVVGVNAFKDEKEIEVPILTIDPEVERVQAERLARVRRERDEKRVEEALEGLRRAAVTGQNTMPHFVEAALAYATLGEMMEIVSAALQEDVDAIGLSILSGAHMHYFKEVKRLLDEQGASDILLFGGGIIPDEDVPKLLELGVAAVFGPGTLTQDIVEFLKREVPKKWAKTGF